MGAAGMGGMVVFLHGLEFGLPVVMTGMIVIGVVMASVLVLGMVVRVVARLVRGRCVYRVTHGLSL
jgi:hypothetical protein